MATADPTTTAARERIGPAEVLTAVGCVSQGRVFDLGTDLHHDMPQGPREVFGGFRITQYHVPRCVTAGADDLVHDFSMEVVQGAPHLGSHLDAPSHIASRGFHFGGVRAVDAYDDFGWKRNGVETVPPILTRGVLLDVPASEGVERLPDLDEITVERLERCLAAQGTELRRGDAVLVRTGKFADYAGDGGAFFGSQPGVGVDAAIWLHERGMAVLGTDTSATEVYPFPDPGRTVHEAMLVDRGVYLVEILSLDELAAARAYEFLFVCLPLRIRGGTGSWVRPVAVV